MAVKREKRTEQVPLPDVATLAAARWFAGKGRAVAGIEHVGGIAPDGARGASLVLVDVAYDSGESERYALALRDGRECGGDDPLWAALAGCAGVEAVPSRSRFLAEDLSNTVVSLDDRLVVKLFRRLERGPHPEAELLGALAGFAQVPELAGVVDHDGMTIGLVEEYVAGVPVGWEGLIARLAAGDDAPGEAADLGRVAAALHRQFAAALGVRLGRGDDVATEHAAATTALADAGFVELEAAIGARLAKLGHLVGAPLQRVHGDLHIGQILRASRGLVVIDFEGDPSLPLAERSCERSPLVDLASLLLSLDHAGCAAAQRQASFDWRAWSSKARAACLSAYELEAGAVDRELLRALEVAKEIRELVYASRWLPEWLYAPRTVLPTLLEDGA
jgi:maltokinase